MAETPDASSVNTVIAIDPGTAKCGVAIVRRPGEKPAARLEHVAHHEVVPTDRLVARILALLTEHRAVDAILIGNATRGSVLRRAIVAALTIDVPVVAVEEAFTSQRARVRFQIENPPRGWRRLVPLGLRTPPQHYDDYVAILLAEDYFAASEMSV